ncbi:sensor histidine kinase [Petrachloros mirabilis]
MRRQTRSPSELADEVERLRKRIDQLERERVEQAEHPSSRSHPSAEHFKLLYEDTPSMSFALDPTGMVLSVNRFGAEQLGYTPEELIERSILLVFDPADHETVRSQLRLCAENPYKIFQWEIQKVHRNGRRFWVGETARAVRNDAGQLIILVLCEDISARKTAEAISRSVTEQLKALIRTSPLAIVALDPTGEHITLWNQAAEAMFGWSKKEVLGNRAPFLPMDSQDHSNDLYGKLIKNGQLRGEELHRVKRDGTPIILSLWATVIQDQKGHVISTFGLIEDITARKQAVEALQKSESRFRELAETVEEVFWSADPSIGTMLYISPAYERVWGRTCASLYEHPKSFLDAIHPDDRRRVEANLSVQQDGLPFAHEYRVVRPDGTIRWVWDRGFPVRNHETGRITHYVGVALDITGRKQAEQELRLVRERLQHLLAMSPSVIYSCKASGDYAATYVSENILDQMGYLAHEFTDDSSFWMSRIHQDDKARVVASLTDLFARGSQVLEYRFLHKDGTYRWMHDRVKLIHDASGDPVEIIGSWIDITDQKQAEEALRCSEERFSKAFRSSPHPIVITELESGRCIEVNDASLELFGFTRDEVIGQTTLSLGIWPTPDDRQQLFDQITREGSVRNLERTFYTKDRSTRRCLVSCELIELNGVKCVVTVGTDITEQTRAAEALRRSELAVRLAFEERERLSQDLHDNLLQSLYAVGMGLEVTKQKIPRSSPTNVKRLEDSVTQLNGVIRDLRGFIPRMAVPAATVEGLADGLRSLAQSFTSTGSGSIAISIDEIAANPLSPEQGIQVLAIAKEALSNSMRHSKAAKRSLSLSQNQRGSQLKIEDNGVGFTVNNRRFHGMGIKNMRARARKLGAKLSIVSARGKGTRVTLMIPIDNTSVEALPLVSLPGGFN